VLFIILGSFSAFRSQSFHSTSLREKDFRSSRAAASPNINSQPFINFTEKRDEVSVYWWKIIHLVISEERSSEILVLIHYVITRIIFFPTSKSQLLISKSKLKKIYIFVEIVYITTLNGPR